MGKSKKIQVANNKKARYDYFILDTYEAGMVLTGTEIKSMRNGKVSIKESFARVENGEMYIFGMHISPYEQGNINNVDPLRTRKLLLHKKEITKIEESLKQSGLTIVPLSLYINEDGKAKLNLGIARGKKLYDKRDTIAKKDSDRRIDRAFKKEQR